MTTSKALMISNQTPRFLFPHIGYNSNSHKTALIQVHSNENLRSQIDVHICSLQNRSVLIHTKAILKGEVEGWTQGSFYHFEFSELQEEGEFYFDCEALGIQSYPFKISKELVFKETISDLLFYFKGQRSTDKWDRADQKAPLFGTDQRFDVRGGWYDASGDYSKYLSHLSYANFMNPQQTPLVAWSLFESADVLADKETLYYKQIRERMNQEALHGCDFLMRMFNQEFKCFYKTLFDKWSKDTEQRELCSYKTQLGVKEQNWQAGFRHGAGLSIAALAKAGAQSERGNWLPEMYLETAQIAYAELIEDNKTWLEDGQENIIDNYTALIAAIELFKATQENNYWHQARLWTGRLLENFDSNESWSGFFKVREGERVFYHAAEAGLPLIALMMALEIEEEPTNRKRITLGIQRGLEFELGITSEVNNPFELARQYAPDAPKSEPKTRFFMPHDNETGYWWQGENARLASLATLGYKASQFEEFTDLSEALTAYADSQLDWILGKNPYDTCMMQGKGRNNPVYEEGWPNAPGGICNGITAGFFDEADIDFIPITPETDCGDQRWRWGEQWIPHGAWFILATSYRA